MATKLKGMNRIQLASIAFYGVTGILLLAFLPLTSFAPHLGFLGIVSLITAYSLITKRAWAPWLVFILLVTNSVFGLYTLVSIGFSNVLVALAMLAFTVLTWVVSALLLLKRKS
jgi:hypothetical protein